MNWFIKLNYHCEVEEDIGGESTCHYNGIKNKLKTAKLGFGLFDNKAIQHRSIKVGSLC